MVSEHLHPAAWCQIGLDVEKKRFKKIVETCQKWESLRMLLEMTIFVGTEQASESASFLNRISSTERGKKAIK